MHKRKVLFICSHNSARSQMAQGWLNHLAGDRFEAESAGFEAGTIKSAAVQAMAEVGIDIAHHTTKTSLDLFGQGRHFGYIVNVCDKETTLERCPTHPGFGSERLDWSFPAPTLPDDASEGAKLEKMRVVRDTLREKIEQWLAATF